MFTNNKNHRALIVGAGPTGLTLGLCLQTYGIKSDIVDMKSGPSRDSKALAVNPLSQHQFELFGEMSAVGVRAQRVYRLNVLWNGIQRLNPVDLRWLDYDRSVFLIQPQHVTEQELVTALERRGGSVDWKTEVLSVQTHGDGVEVMSRLANGDTSIRTYEYVVGCDGKRSIVRNAIGARLEGNDYDMHLVLGDFRLDWDADPRQVHYFVYEDTFFVFVPMADALWRVVVKHNGVLAPGTPGISTITGPVNARFGRNIFQAGPFWLSSAPLYERVASQLSSGRLFIAGDAAHLFSPLGGTGMNTGMQDAFNLGWKLAFILLGWTRTESLLASYEQERLPAIRANAVATDWTTRAIARQEPMPVQVGLFMPRPSNRRVIAKQFPMAFSGLALRYETSDALSASVPGATADRVGTISLGITALLRKLPARSRTAGPPLRVIVYMDTAQPSESIHKLFAKCRRFPAVECIAVVAGETPMPEVTSVRQFDVPVITLGRDEWRRLGGSVGSLQVIRPDGIISYEGRISASLVLLDYLESLVGQPARVVNRKSVK